jgi:hypothetical protein
VESRFRQCIQHTTLRNGNNNSKEREVKTKCRGDLDHVKIAFNQEIRREWSVQKVAREVQQEELVGGNARTH